MERLIRMLAPHRWRDAVTHVLFFTVIIAALNVLFATFIGPYIPGGPLVYQIINGAVVGLPFVLFFFTVLLRHVRHQQHLSFLSRKDGLTGLNNRYSFFEIAERRNKQIQIGILLILDADHFKQINDNYGHQAGDNCLKSIAYMLKRNLREGDVIGRIGGEEFAILLTNTGPSQAHVIGQRLTRPIPFYVGPEDQTLTVTLSIGAVVTSPAISLDVLFARADKALYLAKSAGRARIVFAQDSRGTADLHVAV